MPLDMIKLSTSLCPQLKEAVSMRDSLFSCVTYALNAHFFAFLIAQIGDQVGRGADQRIYRVSEERREQVGETVTDDRQKEGVATEEHIVGSKDHVRGVCKERHQESRNDRKETFGERFCKSE